MVWILLFEISQALLVVSCSLSLSGDGTTLDLFLFLHPAAAAATLTATFSSSSVGRGITQTNRLSFASKEVLTMKLKPFFISRQSITNLSRTTRRCSSIQRRNDSSITAFNFLPQHFYKFSPLIRGPKFQDPTFFIRSLHSLQEVNPINSDTEELDSDDGPMNEFLSRFTWIMRGKLSEVYLDCDKETINGMLLIIVEKVVMELEKGGPGEMLGATENSNSQDFSQDLWKTVWEVSNMVHEDMKKAKKKEAMKTFLQSEDVKEMSRFATEVGIRGDMLREFRFKWAREKMEENDFYDGLKRLREQDQVQEEQSTNREKAGEEVVGDVVDVVVEEKPKVASLPQRRGKIKYKIYGLDMSDPKWAEMSDRIHEAEKLITPEEPKPITGKCKLVTEKILTLTVENDPSPLLVEWVELLQPNKIDWLTLLDRVEEHNAGLFFKISELVLNEESFQANIQDYSKLIAAHAKENHMQDAERILKKMSDKGIQLDILTSTILVHMYSKAGNLDCAKEAFERLRSQGFQPDMRAYNSMIMAYVNSGDLKSGDSLMREMETRGIKPTKEIYMALLSAYSQRGHVDHAQRYANMMHFAEIQPSLESCTLLVEAYEHAGDPEQARNNFDNMMKLGIKPDDRCTASVIAAYGKKNLLDKALNLLLQLEKDGFEPGVATYTVLIDWLGKLKLVDEAEELLGKIAKKGDAPPLKVHVSLCEMYSKSGNVKKALQALGILEGKKEILTTHEFERIISGLLAGNLLPDAQRVHGIMQSRGFTASQPLQVELMASQGFRHQRPKMLNKEHEKAEDAKPAAAGS